MGYGIPTARLEGLNAPSVAFGASAPAARGSILALQILHRAAGEVAPAARRETEGAFGADV